MDSVARCQVTEIRLIVDPFCVSMRRTRGVIRTDVESFLSQISDREPRAGGSFSRVTFEATGREDRRALPSVGYALPAGYRHVQDAGLICSAVWNQNAGGILKDAEEIAITLV